jgi:MFS transporter, MCT family, solute carrier family 16 (monocarboxylic acid transporters), member 10
MTVKAEKIGIPSELSIYLLSIVNASTIPGRILCGFIARKRGALNITIITTSFTVAVILAWAFVTDTQAYIIVSVLYG